MDGLMEMDRRGLLQRIALLVGAAAIPAGCKDFSGDSPEEFAFSDAQRASLAALADTILPRGGGKGALDVKVPQLFEQLLRNWASPEHRAELVQALGKVEAAARRVGGKPLSKLDTEERYRFLRPYDEAALQPAPTKVKSEQGLSALTAPAYADASYARLKQLLVLLYYYSEHGQTVEMNYVHTPGRWDPSVRVTPETRPEGGPALF